MKKIKYLKKIIISILVLIFVTAFFFSLNNNSSNEFSTKDLFDELESRNIQFNKVKNIYNQNNILANSKTIKINDEQLYIYEYKSSVDALNQTKNISDGGYTVNKVKIEWKGNPKFYLKGRIIVLYLGERKDILDNLEQILGSKLYF